MRQSNDCGILWELWFIVKVHFLAKMIEKISLPMIVFDLNSIKLDLSSKMIFHIVLVNVKWVVLHFQISFSPLFFVFELYLIVTIFVLLFGKPLWQFHQCFMFYGFWSVELLSDFVILAFSIIISKVALDERTLRISPNPMFL